MTDEFKRLRRFGSGIFSVTFDSNDHRSYTQIDVYIFGTDYKCKTQPNYLKL